MRKLAYLGGEPAVKREMPAWPIWGSAEEENLLRALDRGQWGTLGDQVVALTKRFAQYVGVKHAIGINNGTQALEILLRGAGIGYGDEVIVPAYTFVATASAVAFVGATPVFCDVGLDTGVLDPESVKSAITDKTRAVLAVHIAGRPCDMDALSAICRDRGLYLFEDASHAHGSEWRGRRVGALSDGAAFSCQSSKILTAGEGGLLVTDREDIYAGCWHYHNSGRALEGAAELGGRVLMGTNGRMAEWEAAVLDAQLDRLDEQNDRRERSARVLLEALRGVKGLALPTEDERVTKNGYYIFPMRMVEEEVRASRAEILQALNAEGVPASAGYPPLHDMGMFKDPAFEKSTGRVFNPGQFDLARMMRLAKTAIWIPGRALLMERRDIEDVAEAVSSVFQHYGI